MALSHWYTVEYDENSVAWLVDETKRRLCLEHGMRLYIGGWGAPAYPPCTPQPEPTPGREGVEDDN